MEQSTMPVPVLFADLLDAVLPDGPVRCAIDELLEKKKQGMEKKYGPVMPEINRFIKEEIQRLEQLAFWQERKNRDIVPLNMLFREILGRR
jgi:predicted nucleotidyltransferase